MRWAFVLLLLVNAVAYVWFEYWGAGVVASEVAAPVPAVGAARIELVGEPGPLPGGDK